MQATWIDPTGVQWPLTDTADSRGYFTRTDISGWGARPYEFVTDPIATGGESVRFIRSNSARITWPLYIRGDTHLEFLTRWRDLRTGTPGTLRVSRSDGTAREIDCFLEDGFQGQGGENWLWANAVLTLYAPDGAWRDSTVIHVPRTYTPGADFLNPFPTISSAQVLGRVPIDNQGELTAWPSWLITGPATVITATNYTTSQSWVLTTTLAAGETATVNTLPRPTARGPVGQNLVSSFNWPDAYLWPLLAGVNDVEFVVAGASTGTAIEMVYQARYEGA
jgi:hypothetical protein